MEDKEIQWITVNGRHIPLGAGESKEDAIKRAFGDKSGKKQSKSAKKSNDDIKNAQISKTQNEADKLNKESERSDALKKYTAELKDYGNKAQVNNGQLTFDGQKVEALSLADAGEKGDDALADNMVNGQLTPERLALHAEIMNRFLGKISPYAKGEEKVAFFTGGGGASGKGAFSKDMEKYYGMRGRTKDNTAILDPDEIKKHLAIADGHFTVKNGKIVADLSGKLAGYYHEESSALAKQLWGTSLKHGYPVMFDGTATGIGSALKKISQAKSAGYKTSMNFIRADFKTIRANALKRYENQGRFVPVKAVVGAHKAAYEALQAQLYKYDSIQVWDNTGHNMTLIGKGSGGNFKITNQSGWNAFKNQAKEFDISVDEQKRFEDDARAIDKKLGRKSNF